MNLSCLLIFFFNVLTLITAHGRLREPAARSTAWRVDSSYPAYYNDHVCSISLLVFFVYTNSIFYRKCFVAVQVCSGIQTVYILRYSLEMDFLMFYN